MKQLMIIIIAIAGLQVSSTFGQGEAPEELKKEMQKLSYMAGKWKGEASIRQPDGSVMKVNQEEDIQYKLDGTILLVEGTGRNPVNNNISFNALAVVSYNPYSKSFGMKSHIMDGRQTEAYFKVLGENHFEWGFETPDKAKIKYDLVLNPQQNTWIEKGEYSPDGNTWFPFMEMKLKKITQ
jgi:hypothetical protein